MSSRRLALASALAVMLLGGIATVASAEEDHLVGYKSKDLDKIAGGAPFTFTNGFGSTTCELKKAKFYLVRGEKNGGDDARGGPAGKFVCYKAKCDGALPANHSVNDQFGSHTLETKKVQIVCAPAQADCKSAVGGFCWFLGAVNQSCDTVCTNNDRVYDAATDTYAGSTGTLPNCQAVMNDFGVPGVASDLACADAVGCFTSGGNIIRCTAPPTTAGAAQATAQRACACQ